MSSVTLLPCGPRLYWALNNLLDWLLEDVVWCYLVSFIIVIFVICGASLLLLKQSIAGSYFHTWIGNKYLLHLWTQISPYRNELQIWLRHFVWLKSLTPILRCELWFCQSNCASFHDHDVNCPFDRKDRQQLDYCRPSFQYVTHWVNYVGIV